MTTLRPGSLALTILLATLTGLGPLSMDMYLPSLPAIAHVLDARTAEVQLTISSYLFGFAVGQIVYGPLSDRYGRRPVMVAALLLYAAATLICAVTWSIETLIAARLMQALGASGTIVLARAMVRDLHSGAQAGRELSLMGSIMALAPIAAPMIGGVLQVGFGWRASFVLMTALAALALAAVGRLLPETLAQRGARLSAAVIVKNYAAVARHRGFLAYLGIITASYTGLLTWVSGASVVLQGVYGLSAMAFGFAFALGSAGYLIGTAIASQLVLRLGLDRTIGFGVSLLAAGGLGLAAAVAAPIGGIWLVVAMGVYLAGLGLSMPQAMAGALTPFRERAGTASSLMGFVQQTVAAVVAAAIGGSLSRSAWPMAGVIASMGCAGFVLWLSSRRVRLKEF